MISRSSKLEMDKENFFSDDITKKSSTMKIDDFASVKDNTMDFLSHERAEKSDVEKPKVDVDDFLNFHDDIGEAKEEPENLPLIPTIEKKDEKFDETKTTQPEPEIDFHAIEDEYLNPYASTNLQAKGEAHNEKFISSEDLLTDFKDPIPAPAEVPIAEAPKPVEAPIVEAPKPVEVPKPVIVEQPPVTEPVKPVVEPPKPKSAPPPAPVKSAPPTSDDTQIEAEKIFKSIGLG